MGEIWQKLRNVLFVLTMAFLPVGFWLLLSVHAPVAFDSELEDLTYAWFVPVFSLYVLWVERAKIRESVGSPSWLGLVATVPTLALGFLGVRGIQIRFEIMAFAGLLVTIPWAFYGSRTARRMLFPAMFLLFCMPILTYLDVVTVQLRLFATSTAYSILHGLGADIVREGTIISVGAGAGAFKIDVAAPCSGMRSIFALLAIAAGYGYFHQPTWPRRAILFVAAVPFAILGNVMRLIAIAVVGGYASRDFAMGFCHDYSGYVVFAVALALLLAFNSLIDRFASRFPAMSRAAAAPSGDALPPSRIRSLVPVFTALLVSTSMVCLRTTPPPVVAEPPPIALGPIAGFDDSPGEQSEIEKQALPADTKIERRTYRDRLTGAAFSVVVVIGGREKSSIHRPELCLQCQGWQLHDITTIRPGDLDWRSIMLSRGTFADTMLAYTFFNQAGYYTCSHKSRIFRDVWDRTLYNRIDRWVMVEVHAYGATPRLLANFIRKLEEAMKVRSEE